ncbi:hypothetical protein [Rufibacter soli]
MEEVKLYINDTLVDLPADLARQLRVSKGGADVADMESRSGDHSYTLVLPPTRVNEKVFKNRTDAQTTGKFFAPTPFRARLEVGGREILAGVWRLTGVKGGYEGKILSDEVDLFSQIGEKTLRQLTAFTPWVYQGKHSFVGLLPATAATSDVCLPLVAYGNFFAPEKEEGVDIPASAQIHAPLELDDYLPGFFFTPILKNIFASVGWQAQGEPLEDPFFAQLFLPYTGEGFGWNWGELLKLKASAALTNNTSEADRQNEGLQLMGFDTEAGKVYFYQVLSPLDSYNPAQRYRQWDQLLTPVEVYAARVEASYNVTFKITSLQATYRSTDPGGIWLDLQLVRVPVGYNRETLLEHCEVLASKRLTKGANGAFTLSAPYALAQEGDLIFPILRVTEPHPSATGLPVLDYALTGMEFTVTPDEQAGPLAVDIAANLPEWNAKDFVKAFVAMGNLRFQADPLRKVLTFYYHERYELPADFALDLSGLADIQRSEYLPATTARRFGFRYAEDSSDAWLAMEKEFGNYSVESGNANAVGEQVLPLPFAATRTRVFQVMDSLGTKVGDITLPCLASQDQLEAPLNTVAWAHGYLPRLLRYEGLSPVGHVVPLAFLPQRTSLGYGEASFARFGQSSTRGLSWEELYQRHYVGYVTQVSKGHLLKNTFALDADLYQRLHPARPILFGGILHRLNKIQGFAIADPQAKAEIELFPIIK